MYSTVWCVRNTLVLVTKMNEVRAIGSGFFEVKGKVRCFLCVSEG